MLKNIFKSKCFLLFILLLSYLFVGNMLAIYSTPLPYRDILKVLISFTGFLIIFLYLIRHKVKKSNILLKCLLFIIFTIIPTFFLYYKTTSFTYTVLEVGESYAWIGVLVISYYFGRNNKVQIESVKWIAFLVPVYSFLFLGVKQFSANTGIPLITTAYYAMFLLPFVFLLKNEVTKWILIIMVFSTVLLSVKRTGFISFILCLVVYFYYHIKYAENSNVNKNKKVRVMILTILMAVIMYFFFEYYTSIHSIGIVDRLNNIGNDGGSGRLDVWEYTWGMIKNSNFSSLLFGHGFNAVYNHSNLKLSAHTDVLEVIYDYGMIGSVVYLTFIRSIFSTFKYVKFYRKDLVPAYATSLVLFTSVSILSHLIIYPTYFLYLCLFLGLVIGNIDYCNSTRRNLN